MADVQPEMPAADAAMFRQLQLHRLQEQLARADDLGKYTVELFKKTLGNAERTYRRITMMNSTMFGLGIALVVASAIYGPVTGKALLPLVFGSLGVATVLAMFLTGPIKKTQTALSNLVQAEIAFMNFFEQITYWENYAQLPRDDAPLPDPAKVEHASEMLQQRSQETIQLLQEYLEKEG